MHEIYKPINKLNNEPKLENFQNYLACRLFDGFAFGSLHFFLILSWVIVFIFLNVYPDIKTNTYIGTFMMPKFETLQLYGAKNSAKIFLENEYWRLWTPLFLHYSATNLLLDIFGVLYFGCKVERALGVGGFVCLLLFIPPIASLFSLALEPAGLLYVTYILPFSLMGAKVGWICVNSRECCVRTGAMLTEIMLGVTFLGLMSWWAPADPLAVAGALLGGYLLGMFVFGCDGQGHSIAMMVLAIFSVLGLIAGNGWMIYKDIGALKAPNVDGVKTNLDQYFNEVFNYNMQTKDFGKEFFYVYRDYKIIIETGDFNKVKEEYRSKDPAAEAKADAPKDNPFARFKSALKVTKKVKLHQDKNNEKRKKIKNYIDYSLKK